MWDCPKDRQSMHKRWTVRREDERKRLINDVCNNVGLSNQKDEISISWDGKDYRESRLVENQLS